MVVLGKKVVPAVEIGILALRDYIAPDTQL
jgi:hypothetical protein